MKFLGFLLFVFIFLMAFWALLFLGSVIPYFIFVWFKEGKLKNNDTIIEGIENFHEAFLKLFSGDKLGKLVLKIV